MSKRFPNPESNFIQTRIWKWDYAAVAWDKHVSHWPSLHYIHYCSGTLAFICEKDLKSIISLVVLEFVIAIFYL